MAELTASVITEVFEVCRKGAAEAAEAFGRALDLGEVRLEFGEPGEVVLGDLARHFDGPGLAVLLSSGGSAAILALPESSGLVPGWCASPDPTGKSKLTTLAQELGMILLPEDLMPDDFQAGRVKSLKGALARGGIRDGSAVIPLEISAGAKAGPAILVLPATRPGAVLGAAAAEGAAQATPPKPVGSGTGTGQASAGAGAAEVRGRPRAGAPVRLENLPGFSRSILRIRVPVVVTLAEKRQPLSQIMELGPGSIIQFEKSCEELLALDIGGRPVATGEAVKVGEKFGLRINSITLPAERFEAVRPHGTPAAG